MARDEMKVHCVSKNVSPFTDYSLDEIHDPITIIFGRSVTGKSKESEGALFSHLSYLVLQHYLAKEETQKTAHWCIVRATQSNCCSALDFLSPEPCPQQPRAEHIDYKMYGVIQQRVDEL